MEELFPKMLEYGALAIISILLIVKGVKAMHELTNAVGNLADKVDRLADKVEKISDRQSSLENEVKFLSNRFEKLESRFENGLQDLRELFERRVKIAKSKDN